MNLLLPLALILTTPVARATPAAEVPLPASDWITMGEDCRVFAAGDVDGDGWADFLTINGNRDLYVAASVNGWKSAAWRAVASDVNPQALAIVVLPPPPTQPERANGAAPTGHPAAGAARILVIEPAQLTLLDGYANGRFSTRRTIAAPEGRLFTGAGGAVALDDQGGRWQIVGESLMAESVSAAAQMAAPPKLSPPPYDADATEAARLTSGFAPDGGEVAWTVFKTDLPRRHLVVRMAVIQSPIAGDSDADGLSDDEERSLQTDPRDRDTDGDGLLDGWEVHGLPRVVELGERVTLFDPAASAEQRDRQLDPRRQDVLVAVSYFPDANAEGFRKQMGQVERVYRGLQSANPDASKGAWIHFIELPGLVAEQDTRLAWWDVGNKYLPQQWRGMVHWMQVTAGGGGQSSETGDMGSSSHGWAAFAHELGHQLSLSHTGDSAPGLCPLYTSLMNYAYNYSFGGDGSAIHFSAGALRDIELDERRLIEKLPVAFEKVKFLSDRPFRFTLEDAGDGTTLIDWNHNGVFDEEPVEADINYGYSTHAGERKTHELIGSSPALAYAGATCILAAARHKHDAITVKAYLGEEKWSETAAIPGSASVHDPVLAGGPDGALLLFRRATEWRAGLVAVEDGKPVISKPVALPELPLADVSAVYFEGRWLLVSRYDDDRLEARWLSVGDKSELSEAIALKSASQVPVGLAVDPADGAITMVGAVPHEKAGPFTMQITHFKVQGDALESSEPLYTHNGRGNHCTSRPSPAYRGEGAAAQLAILHTGWPAENGTWTGFRTLQVKNTAMSGGWLTNQMYDEWTRSRVAAAFANGPQGAIYAFRWDPGDHGEWKVNTMFVAHAGWGIDDRPMRDFDDAAKISKWGIRHSILTLQP